VATQYQQVVMAIKSLGGRASPKEIWAYIQKTSDGKKWTAKTPTASISSYLTTRDEFKKDGDKWVYEELGIGTSRNILNANKNQDDSSVERGLYFITLNPAVKPPVPGILFKIGKSDGRADQRLRNYSSTLPYQPIQELAFFRVPTDVDLKLAEDQVRIELLANKEMGFIVERFFGNHQTEWLQTLDLSLTEENITKLAKIVNRIIQKTIHDLQEVEDR
jgi:hypothetical protein